MDDIAVRGMALAAVLAPMAVSDIRHRSVPTRAVYAGYAVAVALLVYGALDGALAAGLDAGTLAMILGCAAGGLMILAGRVLGVLLGEADGHVLAVSSLVVPWHGDVPVALYGVAAAAAKAAVSIIAVVTSPTAGITLIAPSPSPPPRRPDAAGPPPGRPRPRPALPPPAARRRRRCSSTRPG